MNLLYMDNKRNIKRMDPCIDMILDSNLYMSTSRIRPLYIHCEYEVPMTICNIENEVWMNLLHTYTFTRISNDNC